MLDFIHGSLKKRNHREHGGHHKVHRDEVHYCLKIPHHYAQAGKVFNLGLLSTFATLKN